MFHGSISIPGKTEHDEVVITTDEIAASGLDYLALGHWHSAQTAKAGGVTYAYSGAPEPVALDQDRAGKALLVELDDRAGTRTVTVQELQVGQTRFDKTEVDAATVASQPALVDAARGAGRPRPRPRCPAGRVSSVTTLTSHPAEIETRARAALPQDPRPRSVASRP